MNPNDIFVIPDFASSATSRANFSLGLLTKCCHVFHVMNQSSISVWPVLWSMTFPINTNNVYKQFRCHIHAINTNLFWVWTHLKNATSTSKLFSRMSCKEEVGSEQSYHLAAWWWYNRIKSFQRIHPRLSWLLCNVQTKALSALIDPECAYIFEFVSTFSTLIQMRIPAASPP